MTRGQEAMVLLLGNAVLALVMIVFQEHLSVFVGLLWGVVMCWSIVAWDTRWYYSVGMQRWYRRW
jgi:hypothetical protein